MKTEELNYIGVEQFKKKAKEENIDIEKERPVLQKKVDTEVKQVEEDEGNVLLFAISTASEDRDSDTIDSEGWELENYQKNPVVLWCHDYKEPPVGKALETWMENGKLRSRAQFPEESMNPFGYMVYQMYREGYLNATSVGFVPLEWTVNEERSGFMPMDFKRQELLEYSAVPVPANPEALVEARSKGINTNPLLEWAEKTLELDGYEKQDGMWVPKEQAKEVYETLRSKKVRPAINVAEGKNKDQEKCTECGAVKGGRVLSQENEKKLREAKEDIKKCDEKLNEILEQLDYDDDDKGSLTTPEENSTEIGELKEVEGLTEKLNQVVNELAEIKGQFFNNKSGDDAGGEEEEEPYIELEEESEDSKNEEPGEVEIEAESLQDIIQQSVKDEIKQLKTELTGKVD